MGGRKGDIQFPQTGKTWRSYRTRWNDAACSGASGEYRSSSPLFGAQAGLEAEAAHSTRLDVGSCAMRRQKPFKSAHTAGARKEAPINALAAAVFSRKKGHPSF